MNVRASMIASHRNAADANMVVSSNATTTLVHQIYNAAFKAFDMGYAAAMSFVLFGIILLVSLASLRWGRSEVSYT